MVLVINDGPPLEEIIAFLLSTESQLKAGDDVSHAHIIAPAETKHVGKMVEGLLDGSRSVDFEECIGGGEPRPHVVACVSETPDVAPASVEDVFRHEHVARACSKCGLLALQGFPTLLDAVASRLVLRSVRRLVLDPAITNNLAAAAI